MKTNPKNKRREAEVACEWYAHEILGCAKTVRSVRTQWQRQDMFSCDVLGKRTDGSLVALQVTAGQADKVLERKKKLEKEYWHILDTVQVLQLVQTDNPGTGSRKLWFFRVYNLYLDTNISLDTDLAEWKWETRPNAVPVPKEWFKKWRGEKLWKHLK